MTAVKKDVELWGAVKYHIQGDKKWNARMGQQAAKLYKDLGGRYGATVKKDETSMNKWTREDWQYVSPKSKRYLPAEVIASMTPQEKAAATRTKTRLGKNYAYPKSTKNKMKEAKIF